MEGLRNTPGFLGTDASLLADINLIAHILMYIVLCLGVTAQLRRKYHWHDRFQIPVVVLNFFFIAFIMIPSFLTIAPQLPGKLGDPFYLIPTIHAALGLLTQGIATYCLLAGLKILPRKIGVLRFWMWTTFVLWTIVTILGIGIYIVWYTGGSSSAGTANEHAADLVGEHNAAEIGVAATQAPAEAVTEHAQEPVAVEPTNAPAGAVEEHAEATIELVQEHAAEATVELVEEHAAEAAAATTEPSATPAPTATPAPPTPTPAPVRVGLLTVSDDKVHSDKVSLALAGVTPPPDGSVYEAWLEGENQPPFSLGKLTLNGDAINHTFTDPNGRNLLGLYNSMFISVEPANDTDPAPSGVKAYAGQVPTVVMGPIRLAVAAAPDTPDKNGYALRALNQVLKIQPEVGFQKDYSIAQNDLSALKIQAEGILNVIEGKSSPNFGDRDGSGDVYNPGDGFGLLGSGSGAGYLQAVLTQTTAVAQAEGASPETALKAQQTQAAAQNSVRLAEQIRDLELQILKAADTASVTNLVNQVAGLTQSLTDTDGVDLADPGKGGVRTMYDLAQLMGSIEVFPVPSEGVAPAAAPSTPELIDEHAGESGSEHAGN